VSDGFETRRHTDAAPTSSIDPSHGDFCGRVNRVREFPPMQNGAPSPPSKTPAELRAHAEEFRRLAETTVDPAMREHLRHLAELYLELANRNNTAPDALT
jgi:hypothetical protein